MSSAKYLSRAAVAAAAAMILIGCGDEQSGAGATTSSAPAASTPAPVATAAAVTAAPTVSAAPAEPNPNCPKDSVGPGTLQAPCEAKGTARTMEVTWTGKMDDAGPSFRVVNKSPTTILYGRIVVYFYDKAGKQLEVTDGGKPRPNQPCAGNLFSGIMKPAEKAVVTFSCVQKKHVPEGAVAIEAEMQTVGFADATEKKSDLFWRNDNLVPDTRPKGGVKK